MPARDDSSKSLIKSVLARLRAPLVPGAPVVHVAAFGKHPAWDDHIPDVGMHTERLVEFRRVLYAEGIRGNIESGAWDAKGAGRTLPSFDHLFASSFDTGCVVGRMWSSRDGKGRSQYPMTVCAECDLALFERMAPSILRQLEALHVKCRATDSGDEVLRAVESAASALSAEAADQVAAGERAVPAVRREPFAALAAHPALGPRHTGLIRILYQIDREMKEYRRREPGTRSTSVTRTTPRAYHLRAPRCASEAATALALWVGFLRGEFVRRIPQWVVCPLDGDWVDLIVGPPDVPAFYCVRVPPPEVPLTTEIPYQIDDEFVRQARERIGAPPGLSDAG